VFKRGPIAKASPLSLRDRFWGVGAAFSALYCIALSFMLFQPEAMRRFAIGLVVFIFCFYFVRNKKGVSIGIAIFVALRIAWGLMAAVLQGPK
jgi:hypothetical protein